MRPYAQRLLKRTLEGDSPEKFVALSTWIVTKWGGITAKDAGVNFFELKSSKMDFRFDRIASKSKVFSFLEPKNHAVYDARVAYSLNWIILSMGVQTKYFPMPDGRNPRMRGFDLEVIIRLAHSEDYQNAPKKVKGKKDRFVSNQDKGLFHSQAEAYSNYLTLMAKVAPLVWERRLQIAS